MRSLLVVWINHLTRILGIVVLVFQTHGNQMLWTFH